MSTLAVPRLLLDGLVDDAAMFPPGNASAETAIREHLRHRSSWYAHIVGPLLVHDERWEEFRDAHQALGSPELRVVILAATRPPRGAGGAVTIAGYETVADRYMEAPGDGKQVALEIVQVAEPRLRDLTLDRIATARAGGANVIAKVRTGGTSAEAFPSEEVVAGVISSAVARGVPLKFTAGLHRAVRHTSAATGFEHHGFLNLLAAAQGAQAGLDVDGLESVLAGRDAEAVASVVRVWSSDDVSAVRKSFVSFGCCGVEDPITDAVGLGLATRERV